MSETLRTTCPYCGVGCGLRAKPDGSLVGDENHPSNFGRLCSKGAALKESLVDEDRLLRPLVAGKEASWDAALDLIAERFTRTIREHGPDATAFYVSGQFLTEDYYVANKLMKGFIGSANIDTNSRLCMASSVAGHVRAFGEDVVPGCYEDLEAADLIVIVGANMAWCHPVLYQRLLAAREARGTRIAVIDPRRTATCEGADLHLPVKGGSDVVLFSGLLTYLTQTKAIDRAWVDRHVRGFEECVAAARACAPSLAFVAETCGVNVEDLTAFYELFARCERVTTLYSQGVNQSVCGTDKVNAIINCHLATGRIGRAGMGPLSLTGQPNAMGGREVGGLANQLAAHMNFSDPQDVERVGRFWRAPRMAAAPGLKAVDMFEAAHQGGIQAIWIAATNPTVSMPRAGRVRAALGRCPFVVVSDCWRNDTTAFADVILPAAAWSEKDGVVTNSERRISRQRAFRRPPGEARPDWWMFAQVGRRMGWTDAFAYTDPAGVFREHAALSAFENEGRRLFDIGALAGLDAAQYDKMEPLQWPCRVGQDGSAGSSRLFADGRFMTADARARMVALSAPSTAQGPLRLNTGRVRDQWHTMTRTGRVARLMRHESEPLLDLHPEDAAERGLAEGDLARVRSGEGESVLRVRLGQGQRRGEAFAPMHWSDQFFSGGPIDAIIEGPTDPVSGQPDLKGALVEAAAVATLWRGLLLRRSGAPPRQESLYWTKSPLRGGYAFELAGWTPLRRLIDSEDTLRALLGVGVAAEIIAYSDPRRFVYRFGAVTDGCLEACVFLAAARSDAPSREEVADLLGQRLDRSRRLAVLAGCAGPAMAPGETPVCVCFSVGARTIENAIRAGGLRDAEEVGAALGAGTNCGSCLPEIKALLRKAAHQTEFEHAGA